VIKAAGLGAKASTTGGGRVLADRFGEVKILVLVNRDRRSESLPSHFLFFAEAPERRRQEGKDARTGALRDDSASWQSVPPRRPSHAEQRGREPADAADRRPFADEIQF
jgi:hypothetical protein